MKENKLHVLLVEEDGEDSHLLGAMFSNDRGNSFLFTHLLRMTDAVALLAKSKVDILLLDLDLPDAHGIEAVRRVRAIAPDIPLIVLTDPDDGALAAAAIEEGAEDYLIKGQIEKRAIPWALNYVVERERRLADAELRRTSQMHLKDEYLSNVSHEFRAPLSAIYSFSSIIADGLAGETSRQQDEYLEIIQNNTKQLQAMIEDLLTVTKSQSGQLRVVAAETSMFNAITYAIDTLSNAADAKGIVVTFDTLPNQQAVYADPTRLRQVITILLDNAIKFTPTGGDIRIQCRLLEDDPTLLRVEVSDTGCGISKEAAKKVFERFNQASKHEAGAQNGLGLGLCIARDLVTRQGGKIWVHSEPAHGSQFCFTVPVAISSATSARVANAAPSSKDIAAADHL